MIALACDHGGFDLMKEIKAYLDECDLEFKDFGTFSGDGCDYPEITVRAGGAVASGLCDLGIFVCGTGIGMAIAANKISGIRAAPCSDCYTAEMTRLHNDANVLTLGARVVGTGLAIKIIETFLNTDFDIDENGRHRRRVEMLSALDIR